MKPGAAGVQRKPGNIPRPFLIEKSRRKTAAFSLYYSLIKKHVSQQILHTLHKHRPTVRQQESTHNSNLSRPCQQSAGSREQYAVRDHGQDS